MTTVRVKAIEPCNEHKPGTVFEVSEREAAELHRMGLVKMAPAPVNKMKPDPKNKRAVGKVQASSALPVAPVSQPTTAAASTRGTLRLPNRGR